MLKTGLDGGAGAWTNSKALILEGLQVSSVGLDAESQNPNMNFEVGNAGEC